MNVSQKFYWIDVHTHLHLLKKDLNSVMSAVQKAGIEKLITIGTSVKDWPLVLNHIQKDFKDIFVYGALGCHPHESKHYSTDVELELQKGLEKKGVVALGEIGLDYYYEHSDKKVQQEVFRRQMEIACQKGLNVEIHTRSAEEDTLSVLSEYKSRVKGLLHCFTGSWHLAEKALDLGYNISFSGILTFKNAQNLRDICKKIPLNRLHIETDAPYLAPAPYRGQENQPAFLLQTAQTAAELQKVSLEKVKEQTWENAQNLFSLT